MNTFFVSRETIKVSRNWKLNFWSKYRWGRKAKIGRTAKIGLTAEKGPSVTKNGYKSHQSFWHIWPCHHPKKLDSQIISFQFRWRSNQFHQMFDNTASLAHSISPKIGLNYPSNFNRFPTCSSSIGLTNPANFHQWSFNSINVTNSNHFPISQIQSISIIWMFSSINPIKVVWKNGQLQPMPPNVHQLNQLKRFNQFRPAWLNWRHKNKLKCKIKTWNERNIKSKIKNREKKRKLSK